MKVTATGSIEVDPPSDEYEQACLEAVRKIMSDSTTLERDKVVVESVELETTDEARRTVVSLLQVGLPRKVEWTLYEDTFHGTLPRGQAENPEGVATGMWIWAMGG